MKARLRPRVPLGLWLAGLTAAATAIVVGAAFALLNVRVNATTRGLIAEQVSQGQQTLIALRRQGDQQFLAAAALLANSPSLRSAMATARVEREQYGTDREQLALTVRRELERLAPDLKRDLVAATDENGRVFAVHAVVPMVARVPDRPRAGLDLGGVPAIRNALDPSLDADATDLYHSTLRVGSSWFHVAAAPIVLDGFTIGTALLGERLDTAYLRALQETFGGELVITSGDSVIASTFAAGARIPALNADDRAPHVEALGGMEYMGADLAVGPADEGVPVRLHLLQPVTPALREATEALLTQFLFWGLLAVVAAGLGTAFVAQRVLDPLDRFVRHLRAGEGDAAHGAPDARPASSLEIRWLHVSFSRLMRSLARKRAQLEHQAWHDPLTGLPNRLRLRAEVDDALAAQIRGAGEVTVLFLDLDHFKTVNDALGHAVGDELLVEVARRLQHAVPASSIVARLGGDEFAVLLRDARPGDDCSQVVDRVLRMLRLPVTLERAEVLVGASIGVVHATRGATADELLRNADVAMYRAKQQGRNRHEVFTPEMHAAVVERLELEADLRRALLLPDADLQLVYQPIVSLDAGRVVGVEALVRWTHPTRGLLSPVEFIPLAEATGLVIPLGRWVLRTACMQAAAWQRAAAAAGLGATDTPYVSVNLSGRQLEDDGLVDDVRDILTASGLEPARLLLEITESVLMQRADASLRVMHALRALGVRLAIDDFGTGYSSLAYLQRFPVDVLKIDKAFVDGVAERGAERALARGIVGLAASLGLRCIAEGIEHEEQAAQLRALGCHYGQGYHFARPLSTDCATALIAERTGTTVRDADRRRAAVG